MKTDFPPVDLTPRKRIDLRSIKAPESDDVSVEINSRKLADDWGAVTTVMPPKGPMASLRLEIPAYLDQELAEKALRGINGQRVTKQFLVIQALQAAGFRVDPDDMVPDKRKRR